MTHPHRVVVLTSCHLNDAYLRRSCQMPIIVESAPARPRHSLRIQLLLFLFVWFACGLTINSGNLTAFGLQQAGVEAYVERHHLYLEASQVKLLNVRPGCDGVLV